MSAEFDWLLRLMNWLSPAYPTGAFGFSHGIEQAVEEGHLTDWRSVREYIGTALEVGSGWIDLVLTAASWQAATAEDDATLDELAELAKAMRGSHELAVETMSQGTAFVLATGAAWPGTALDRLSIRIGHEVPYPVAVGTACAGHVPLEPLLIAFGFGFVSTLVSAAIRLVPLGQTDGQHIIAALASNISDTAARAAAASIEELGAAAPKIDLASMRHEIQYTRLFRS